MSRPPPDPADGQRGGARRGQRLAQRRLLVAMVFPCLLLTCPPSHALRCGTHIVDRDDKMEEVLEACGPPFHQYILKQELIFDAGAFERGRVLATSEWLYNFGPNRLMVLLYFEDERLVAIEHRGRGLSAHARPATVCGARVVHGGDTQGEVLLKCGEPDEIDQVRESVEVRINDFQRVRGPLYSEKWIYEGSGEFLVRVLLFRNNRLQRIFIRDRDDGS